MKKMNEYKVSKVVDSRTVNYRMSVSSKKSPEYIALKETVRLHNEVEASREAAGLEPHYIRVRGRGRNPIKAQPKRAMHVVDSNAGYFDVYICRDTDAMHRYNVRKATKTTKSIGSFITNSVNNLVKPRIAA